MPTNLYLSTTFATDNSLLSEVLEICVQHGIRHFELGSNHVYEKEFARIVQQFDCHYLVHNYFPIPKKSFVVNIASLDDDIYQCSINHLRRSIDFCHEIGAFLYTFHPGFLTDPCGSNKNNKNYDFQFEDQKLSSGDYEQAFDRMLNAISQSVQYAKKHNVQVAIETEGSVSKRDHLLMQRPEEYQRFFQHFSSEDIRINLNIGHLRLASNAFGFEVKDFVTLIEDYIVAIELSHNDGVEDEHRPLEEGEWYWDIISDSRFTQAYKILEFRNTHIETILNNIAICRKYLD